MSTLKVKPGSQLRCCSANTAMSSGRLNHACSGSGLSQSLPSGNVHCLYRAPAGNVLWDCVSRIDDATIKAIEALAAGFQPGLVAPPTCLRSMVEWSHAFGRAPILVHADHRRVGRVAPPSHRVLGRRSRRFEARDHAAPLWWSFRRFDGLAVVRTVPRSAADG